LTADHGELFWEHGLMYHGGIVYSELVQVPLVISGPFAKAYRGHQVFREVETRSLARTIANIAGAENQSFGGENLLEIPTRIEKPRFAFSEGNLADSEGIRNRAVVHDGWKLIHRFPSGRHDLYHLVTDPKEQRNHWSSTVPEVVKKRDQLKRALQEFEENRRPVAPESRTKITPEAQERLRAMGYIE
jgi:arylsulfatase A-like enzyme